MTPRNAAIVRANPSLFAPLVRWLWASAHPRCGPFECGCVICVEVCADEHGIDPDRLVALCTTPDMLPEVTR